jgi:hypothetical protein
MSQPATSSLIRSRCGHAGHRKGADEAGGVFDGRTPWVGSLAGENERFQLFLRQTGTGNSYVRFIDNRTRRHRIPYDDGIGQYRARRSRLLPAGRPASDDADKEQLAIVGSKHAWRQQ